MAQMFSKSPPESRFCGSGKWSSAAEDWRRHRSPGLGVCSVLVGRVDGSDRADLINGGGNEGESQGTQSCSPSTPCSPEVLPAFLKPG